jgi:hypothetical protein
MAKGFMVERRTASLNFAEDSPYYGVEATVKAPSPLSQQSGNGPSSGEDMTNQLASSSVSLGG